MYAGRVFSEEESHTLQLISTIMTETMYSRIFGTAREKGWVYGMGSGSAFMANATGWWLGAQVSKTNSQPILRLIRDEKKKKKNGTIQDEDFEAAKKHLLGKTMRSGQTASGLVNQYGKFYMNDEIEDVNKIAQKIRKIKKHDCVKLFRELTTDSSWGIGVLGATSLVPARKLQAYAAEIFTSE